MNAFGIPSGSHVLLDTVTLIYYLENHPRHGQRAESVLHAIETGEISACISTLALAELLVPLHAAGEDAQAQALTRQLAHFPNLHIHPMTIEMAVRASRLRARHRLRTPDAIHAATALEHGASGIITNDSDFRCLRDEGLQVWLFDEKA